MSQQQTYIEQRKTNKNYKEDVMEARVIANYGDPGLDEDYHFDILSRYVLVMIESCQRVLTSDKYTKMVVLCKRPQSLWIDASTKPDGNPVNQKRQDAAGNVSAGLAGSFSSNGIPRIYPAYSFGETIKIRKIATTEVTPSPFFYSKFADWNASTWGYGSWHSEGSTLPYFKTADMKTMLRMKTIERATDANGAAILNYYMGVLFKYQYEAFTLSLNQGNSSMSSSITTIFDNSWAGNPAVYSANGGYAFSNGKDRIYFNYIGYEDLNVGQKARVATNQCIPMVVTTPSTFPVPSYRSVGAIQYNPTYATITKS